LDRPRVHALLRPQGSPLACGRPHPAALTRQRNPAQVRDPLRQRSRRRTCHPLYQPGSLHSPAEARPWNRVHSYSRAHGDDRYPRRDRQRCEPRSRVGWSLSRTGRAWCLYPRGDAFFSIWAGHLLSGSDNGGADYRKMVTKSLRPALPVRRHQVRQHRGTDNAATEHRRGRGNLAKGEPHPKRGERQLQIGQQ